MTQDTYDKIIKFLNKELDKEAKKLGKTVIPEQADIGGQSSVVLKSKAIR